MSKPKSRGNGTGSVYKLPNGTYRAAVTLGYREDGRRVYRTKSGFKTKKEALEYIPILRKDADKAKDIKFSRIYEDWKKIHYPAISKSKQTAYRIAYNKCEPIHYMNIADVRTKDLQAIIDASTGGYYPRHDIRVLCNMIFKYAMKNDYVVKNYAQFIKLPPVPKSTRDAFNKNEVDFMWKDYNEGNSFTGYILIMIYTGMRLGELQKLHKANIFLEDNYMIGGIKTDAGINRQILIANKIKPIIEKFFNERETKLLEISEKAFYEQFYEALRRAGITRRLTPHSCRHTFATLMAAAGVQPAIIQVAAGHEDYQTTLQYTHISLERKLEAVNKI